MPGPPISRPTGGWRYANSPCRATASPTSLSATFRKPHIFAARPGVRRIPAGRWSAYDYEELINRDKASLDIFRLKDESLEDLENLPEPGVLAAEIVEDLEAALAQFREIAADLNGTNEIDGAI